MGYNTCMKTTIDIADHILLRAKDAARNHHRTLRSLAEEGLVTVLERLEAGERAEIQPVTFKGDGLAEEFADKGWNDIRDAAYEGHGG